MRKGLVWIAQYTGGDEIEKILGVFTSATKAKRACREELGVARLTWVSLSDNLHQATHTLTYTDDVYGHPVDRSVTTLMYVSGFHLR